MGERDGCGAVAHAEADLKYFWSTTAKGLRKIQRLRGIGDAEAQVTAYLQRAAARARRGLGAAHSCGCGAWIDPKCWNLDEVSFNKLRLSLCGQVF